ncbi:MAG: RluA family pseudouridine synthase [Pseudomonadota bacterium]
MEQESERSFLFSVQEEETGKRLDTFLATQVEILTRARIQELIKKGCATVNDLAAKASYRLKKDDHLSLTIPPVRFSPLEPEPVEFALIHEDESLIVLNKPAGLVVHPGPGHSSGTLVHGLLHHCEGLSGIGGVERPGIVHRLDKDTSGLVVVAKNDRVHNALSRQFSGGQVKKKYLALVQGIIKGESGKIDLPIGRHPKKRKEMAVQLVSGKRALTRWQKVETFGGSFTLLSVSPKTGRTHQIRVHLSHLGHPILGDPVYGAGHGRWKKCLSREFESIPPVKRQMLHAETLGFVHPDSENWCEFHAPPPGDMARVLEFLKGIGSGVRGKNLTFGKIHL